jgi:sporadic carbohydrate cluster 2OG-Fe(II) oxygenase
VEINRDINKFAELGYVVLDLYSLEYLNKFKVLILNKMREILQNESITLENFHKCDISDSDKIDLQYQINKMIWDQQLHIKIIEDNINIYHDMIGKDLDIQSQPYLRIARPNAPQDNIGFHRDGMYGNSAYEISNFIPLVDLDENNALLIEPSSHKRGEIPYEKVKSADVNKGDVKNQLGFPYAPKIIDKNYTINKVPIPLKYGQVLIFGLGVIHGQEINRSHNTRWSLDTRVKNSFARSGTKEGYFIKLSSGPVAECAEIFYTNNEDGE